MTNKIKIRLAVIPAAIVTAALTIAVTVLGVKLTEANEHNKVTFPATLINKTPGFPFIINPDDHQPQPAYQAGKEVGDERLIIESVDVPQIKRTIHKLWALDINDFYGSEEKRWFEDDDYSLGVAYELMFSDPCTIFYVRVY